jgi:para-aminobenzoate synthetase/4-amino-4-deoxychorismate lyase
MKRDPSVTENQIILHNADDNRWILFSEPAHIIAAFSLEEIIPAIERIERLVTDHGWYAAGFISYEAANAFDAAFRTIPEHDFPLLWFGIYTQIVDWNLQSPDYAAYSLGEPIPSMERSEYDRAIERIKSYIQSGDTYQVNYTLRLKAPFRGDPFHLFLAMVKAQSEGYSAWIDTGRYAICSASPELFFRLAGDDLTCKPMKGTVHRGRTLKEDRSLAEWLHFSEKNRAENLMIVDMIRNDLGRVAEAGSVRVPRLFEVERHQTLWQMTSTVTARCRKSLAEIMAALFPCASITGAPKVRTTQIIAELESLPRHLYTGCIGYFAPDRRAQFSVAIRTAVLDRSKSQIEYGSGGGIVWDSACKEEYSEALLKARVLTEQRPDFSLLETMLWTPEESFFLLDYHLRRLSESAEYFGYPVDTELIRRKLQMHAASFSKDAMRVRLLVDPEGALCIQSDPLQKETGARLLQLRMAGGPVHSSDIFLYHKTTHRKVYEEARQAFPDCDDVVLWNERGEVTESCVANIVVRIENDYFTPPVDSGLLAGTYRAWLLDTGRIHERILRVTDLKLCSNIYLINSVRKWQEASLKT